MINNQNPSSEMFSIQKKNKSLPEKEATVPTFREFVSQNLSITKNGYNAALLILQIRMEQDILEFQLSDEARQKQILFEDFKPGSVENNWVKFKRIFRDYLHSELYLPEWLQRSSQQNYSETIGLIRTKIESQFINIAKQACYWQDYFHRDKVFGIQTTNLQEIYSLYPTRFIEKLFQTKLPIKDFDIQFHPSQITIAYKTIFELFTQENFAKSQKNELIEELEKRIKSQTRLRIISELNDISIPGLTDFYRLIKTDLENFKEPKFLLKDIENPKNIFRTICKSFSHSPKIFTNNIDDLLDLVDPNTNKGLVFDIDEKNEELFFLFMDTIMKHAIKNIKTSEVVEKRFTIKGNKIKYFSNRKNRKLDQLMDKLKNDKLKSTLGHQLNQHKYKSPRLDNF